MNNKGITLISLTMYVVGITFVIIAVATLTSFFYNNIVDLRDSTDSLSEFDKFNVAFLKEVKNDEVSVINIEKTKITFSNGVTFQFQDNGIYRNYVKICEQIKDCQFSSTTMGENIVIKVYLEIGTDFAKTLEYVGNNKQNNETTKRLILTKSTEEYTNENVIVTLNYINLPEGYEIQYKIGDNQWTAGTSVTVEENNTVVYGRIYNNITLDEKDNNSIIITNIDKEAPTAPTEIEYSSTINSITVRAIGGTDNLSGVAGYQYSINNSSWTETIVQGDSYTFNGIKANTTVTIYARTVDNTGQTSTIYQEIVNTTGVEDIVTLTSSIPEGTWTSGDATVTLSHGSIPSGYELQYKIGNGNWTTGTSALVTQNNATVYGRLYNTTLADEIATNSITITNIDKVNPTTPTGIEYSSTINSITVKASGGTDSISGVAGYQYSIDNNRWTETIVSGTNYTFSGLSAETNYTIYAKTVDNVGLFSNVNMVNIKTQKEKITFTINEETYYADEGMTWEEWVNSEYNTLGLKITAKGYIDPWGGSGIPARLPFGSYVTTNDVLVKGRNYTFDGINPVYYDTGGGIVIE